MFQEVACLIFVLQNHCKKSLKPSDLWDSNSPDIIFKRTVVGFWALVYKVTYNWQHSAVATSCLLRLLACLEKICLKSNHHIGGMRNDHIGWMRNRGFYTKESKPNTCHGQDSHEIVTCYLISVLFSAVYWGVDIEQKSTWQGCNIEVVNAKCASAMTLPVCTSIRTHSRLRGEVVKRNSIISCRPYV